MPATMIVIAALLLAPPSLPIEAGWGGSATWDDGRAEVALYDARRSVYGLERRFETVVLTVKEEMDLSTGVKADPPFGGRALVTVLKMNVISRIPTEIYPYDYMTSVFVSREDPRRLLKLSQSSQEWCGTTYKQILNLGGAPSLAYHSYFDRQADGTRRIEIDDTTFPEEQLLLLMRAAAPVTAHGFRILEPMATNAIGPMEPYGVVALAGGEETLTTPAGDFRTLRIDVHRQGAGQGGGPILSYWIERADRRALVRFEAADGRSLILRDIGRRAYWIR